MGSQSTGSGGSKSVGQMTGKDSPRVILTLPGDNVPNRDKVEPKTTGNTQLTSNSKV